MVRSKASQLGDGKERQRGEDRVVLAFLLLHGWAGPAGAQLCPLVLQQLRPWFAQDHF